MSPGLKRRSYLCAPIINSPSNLYILIHSTTGKNTDFKIVIYSIFNSKRVKRAAKVVSALSCMRITAHRRPSGLIALRLGIRTLVFCFLFSRFFF